MPLAAREQYDRRRPLSGVARELFRERRLDGVTVIALVGERPRVRGPTWGADRLDDEALRLNGTAVVQLPPALRTIGRNGVVDAPPRAVTVTAPEASNSEIDDH
jgi:hypothetical protein